MSDIPPPPEIVRNWQNTVGGLAICVGITGLLMFVDPLAVYSTWSGPGQGFNVENVLFTTFFTALVLVAYAAWVRPRVVIEPDRLIVFNPLHTHHINLNDVAGIDTRDPFHAVVMTRANGRFRAWGLEKSISHDLLGGQLAQRMIDQPPTTSGESGVQSTFKPLGLGAVVLVAPLMIYWLLGIILALT